jgi:hypothetical protein
MCVLATIFSLIFYDFSYVFLQKKDKRRRKDDSGTPRIVAFCSNFGLSLLRRAETWSSDGTFSVCPEPFFQLYSVHAHIGKNVFPAAFLFMPGKKRLQYREALKALKEHVEAMDSSSPLPLKRFLIDFEVAVMSEIR